MYSKHYKLQYLILNLKLSNKIVVLLCLALYWFNSCCEEEIQGILYASGSLPRESCHHSCTDLLIMDHNGPISFFSYITFKDFEDFLSNCVSSSLWCFSFHIWFSQSPDPLIKHKIRHEPLRCYCDPFYIFSYINKKSSFLF